MTTYTSEELATRVLKDLGLIGAEETPSAADMEWAEETCASEISLLAALGLPIWNGNELSIPQEYLTVISRRVGLAISPSFGMMSSVEAMSGMREAERQLTELAAPRTTPLRLRTDLPARGSTFNFTTGR
jgi:hypothetical protein